MFTRAHPRFCITFHNNLVFYGEELLAPHPTPNLEDHPCQLSVAAYHLEVMMNNMIEGENMPALIQ
jgi:hypothetical protein